MPPSSWADGPEEQEESVRRVSTGVFSCGPKHPNDRGDSHFLVTSLVWGLPQKPSLRSPQRHAATETTEVLTLFRDHFLLLRGWGLSQKSRSGRGVSVVFTPEYRSHHLTRTGLTPDSPEPDKTDVPGGAPPIKDPSRNTCFPIAGPPEIPKAAEDGSQGKEGRRLGEGGGGRKDDSWR